MGKVIAFSNQKGGSGKSTLGKTIMKLLNPTKGQIIFNDLTKI